MNLGASDIHIEPFEDEIRVRYRIDGRLVVRDSAPRRLLGAILSRIKILRLDIAGGDDRKTDESKLHQTMAKTMTCESVYYQPTMGSRW